MLMTLTSFGMRGIGVLFNRYLTHRIGSAGLGQFSLMMSVYGFAVTAASAGIHLAITRVVFAPITLQQRNTPKRR